MNLEEILTESRKNKNYLLGISLVELIDREIKTVDELDLGEKVFILSLLIELKSELLLYLFGLVQEKKRTFNFDNDVEDIIEILEKTMDRTYEKKAFIEKVSQREIPISRLSKIVQEILERERFYENKNVNRVEISVQAVLERLKERIVRENEIDFRKLMEECTSRLEVVVTFLAVLILAKNRYIMIIQEDNFSPIILRRNEERTLPLRN